MTTSPLCLWAPTESATDSSRSTRPRRSIGLHQVQPGASCRPPPVQNSDAWRFEFFRVQGMNSLMDDLVLAAAEGISTEERGWVRSALGIIENRLDLLPLRNYRQEKGLPQLMQEFHDAFVTWATHPRGEAGSEGRRTSERAVRACKQSFCTAAKDLQPALSNMSELEELAPELIGALASIIEDRPHASFQKVRRMYRSYRRKNKNRAA